jgi:Protein of unknown function (DUF5818)
MTKRLLLAISTALVFFVATAIAQSTPQTDTQGTQGSSPSMGQGSSASQGGMSQGTETKGEKKLKGCVRSEGGQYVLEEKNGKNIQLTGQDVSAHVGHEVAVHGSWASGGASASASSTGASAKTGREFNVSSVDMISESCSAGKKGSMSNSTTNPPTTPQ